MVPGTLLAIGPWWSLLAPMGIGGSLFGGPMKREPDV